LHVLPYLATHLSFPEIGDRLYLSRHTVKSHAMAIYRKLNVTSRNDAVERARELGPAVGDPRRHVTLGGLRAHAPDTTRDVANALIGIGAGRRERRV
jgi:hypothetical protein